jgi:FRG domain
MQTLSDPDMDKIGDQTIWSYYDTVAKARPVSNHKIRHAEGHAVSSYFDMAKKVAELQFLNRDHVLLFRGQKSDHKTRKGNTTLKASLFRPSESKVPTKKILETRFQVLRRAEGELVERYVAQRFQGFDRLKRYRAIRWAILQHYEVCPTPLLDVTHSLRVAATFASLDNETGAGFVFVLGVPNLSGAVTASSEAGLQVIRLSSACPPEAVRPHLQEGYLLGEYPEIADYEQNAYYSYYEMDFGRRLIAKFRFDPATIWKSKNFTPASREALYPKEHRDNLLNLTQEIKVLL